MELVHHGILRPPIYCTNGSNDMAIYREIFKLKDKNLSLENLLSKVEQSTGLQFDMEIIDRNSAFISCRNLKKVSIEINIEEDGNINIYFPPREKISRILDHKCFK